MSRTYRNTKYSGYYRNPKTFNEVKQIDAIQNDPEMEEYPLGKPNRMNRKIPNAWDDIPVAAQDEQDFEL
jgi:hypothetical protein